MVVARLQNELSDIEAQFMHIAVLLEASKYVPTCQAQPRVFFCLRMRDSLFVFVFVCVRVCGALLCEIGMDLFFAVFVH